MKSFLLTAYINNPLPKFPKYVQITHEYWFNAQYF